MITAKLLFSNLCRLPFSSLLDIFVKLLPVVLSYLVVCCVSLCTMTVPAAGNSGQVDLSELAQPETSTNQLALVCLRFNALNNRIRDNRIDGRSARIELQRALSEVREAYYRGGGSDYPKTAWAFPLAGYDARAIGAGRRHGYSDRGYDFFSGNRHGGHPAFDIFIRDRNRDCLDDRNGLPVSVLSMTGGIVVAVENEWGEGGSLRGGNYIWVYDPAHDLLVYYAHNANVQVQLAEIVRPGDVLATVGRSGRNAAKRRSPTHLHFTVVRLQDGTVSPVNVYRDLTRAVKMPAR